MYASSEFKCDNSNAASENSTVSLSLSAAPLSKPGPLWELLFLLLPLKLGTDTVGGKTGDCFFENVFELWLLSQAIKKNTIPQPARSPGRG